MENEQLNQDPVTTEEQVQQEETMSLSDKMLGVFSEPGKVFTNIASFPIKTKDWIIPILLLIVLSIASQIISMNNPSIQDNMKQEMMKRFQKSIDEGKMTQEQAEQIMENMDKYKSFQYISIFVFIPIMIFIITFISALVYWILVKAGMKGDPEYMSVVTVMSLSGMVSIVEMLIVTILAIVMGKMNAVPSIALLMPEMAEGPLKILLSKINPFTIWWLFLMGIGMAKISKKEVKTGIIWVFGLWIVYIVILMVVIPAVPFLKFLAG